MVDRSRVFAKHLLLLATLTLVALVVVNYLAVSHRVRLDLTADQRFTLSDGAVRILGSLTESVSITYYVDSQLPSKRINLERDVTDKLEELSLSSNGKLQYRVQRLGGKYAKRDREELAKQSILAFSESLYGDGDSSERGPEYFSSIEIKYGIAEPVVLNGVVNNVERGDLTREHRVDTLEFDIAYSLVKMRYATKRPSFDRLLLSLPSRLRVRFFQSADLNDFAPGVPENIHTALMEMARTNGARMEYEQITLPQRATGYVNNPFDSNGPPLMLAPTRAAINVPGRGLVELAFFGVIALQIGEGENSLHFLPDVARFKTRQEFETFFQEFVWQTVSPKMRLGVITPAVPPNPMTGQPGRSGHAALVYYIQRVLGYDVVELNLATQKSIPQDLACLVVMEPNTLPERDLYEINQYLARGGNVIMLVQGWEANLDMSRSFSRDAVTLRKSDMQPHFEDWAKHLGISFGQDLLLRRNAALSPFATFRNPEDGQTYVMPLRSTLRLAPRVEPDDLNSDSVFTRGLTALALPLVVEAEIDTARQSALGLEMTELIRLGDDVYKFVPGNPAMPAISLDLNLEDTNQVSEDPKAEPGEGIMAQKLGRRPLVAAQFRGQFPNLWADEKRKVPGWSAGDPETQDAQAVFNAKPGSLTIVTTAATLNTDYLAGYQERQASDEIIPGGLFLYRNLVEAFIYGEDIVALRVRTGVAPRIAARIDDNERLVWIAYLILSVPVALIVIAALRTSMQWKRRREYEAALAGKGSSGDMP